MEGIHPASLSELSGWRRTELKKIAGHICDCDLTQLIHTVNRYGSGFILKAK